MGQWLHAFIYLLRKESDIYNLNFLIFRNKKVLALKGYYQNSSKVLLRSNWNTDGLKNILEIFKIKNCIERWAYFLEGSLFFSSFEETFKDIVSFDSLLA